jgi:hypothetical protein
MSNYAIDRIIVWLKNLPGTPARWMARYLRRHGWVAFYLDEEQRICNTGTCWLKLYQSSESAAKAEGSNDENSY